MFWRTTTCGSPRVSAKPSSTRARQAESERYIESFNGRFRDECLNEHWFTSLAHARAVIEDWRRKYNDERPKKALGGLTRPRTPRPADDRSEDDYSNDRTLN
jgi:transposase InsO family protein